MDLWGFYFYVCRATVQIKGWEPLWLLLPVSGEGSAGGRGFLVAL